MILILFFFLVTITNSQSLVDNNIKKLSPNDTVDLLKCIDDLVTNPSNNKCLTLYKLKIGTDYNKNQIETIRSSLHNLLLKHVNRTS